MSRDDAPAQDNLLTPEQEQTLKNFAEKLLGSQQPMPPECAKVINDNFWELVESIEVSDEQRS